jgi:hypothetical protein
MSSSLGAGAIAGAGLGLSARAWLHFCRNGVAMHVYIQRFGGSQLAATPR